MKLKIVVKLMILTLLLLAQDFFAQSNQVINKGDRIRVTSIRYFGKTLVAEFDMIRNDTLFLKYSNRLLSVPLSSKPKVEYSVKRLRNTTPGAILGAAVGGIILGMYFNSEYNKADEYSKAGQPGHKGGIIFGGLAGGAIGTAIGYNTSTDIWKEIAISKLY